MLFSHEPQCHSRPAGGGPVRCSTPALAGQAAGGPDLALGGLLYLGSSIGLVAVRLVRDRDWIGSGVARGEWPWLLGAILFGGVLVPVALMFGPVHVSASDTSLLLNLQAVLTAALAWLVFKENANRRITDACPLSTAHAQDGTRVAAEHRLHAGRITLEHAGAVGAGASFGARPQRDAVGHGTQFESEVGFGVIVRIIPLPFQRSIFRED